MKAIVGLSLIVCMVGCEGKKGRWGRMGHRANKAIDDLLGFLDQLGHKENKARSEIQGLHMWPVLIMSVKYLLGGNQI